MENTRRCHVMLAHEDKQVSRTTMQINDLNRSPFIRKYLKNFAKITKEKLKAESWNSFEIVIKLQFCLAVSFEESKIKASFLHRNIIYFMFLTRQRYRTTGKRRKSMKNIHIHWSEEFLLKSCTNPAKRLSTDYSISLNNYYLEFSTKIWKLHRQNSAIPRKIILRSYQFETNQATTTRKNKVRSAKLYPALL